MARSSARLWAGRLFDLLTYAALTTAAFAAAAWLVGAAGLASALGTDPVRFVRTTLFVLGWLAFGYGTLTMRPRAAWKTGDSAAGYSATESGSAPGTGFDLSLSADGRGETRFQRLVQRLPPARFLPVAPDERLPSGVRIFAASLMMLATSLSIDVVAFGLVL